nr:MAG TPA: GTP Cyclohydrolase I [Caudoviricetes sp.]
MVHSKALADKWMKLGYKIVALSYTGCFGETPLTFHLEKKL